MRAAENLGRFNQHAFVALQSRMAGLVRVNVRRVLRDATRSETVTRETFDDARQHATDFDPRRTSAQDWLLTRAHQHALDHGPHPDPDPVPNTRPGIDLDLQTPQSQP